MISFRLLSRLSQLYFILFASFASAILQNVTVDDAVLTGPVVPHYLPNDTVWNESNCTICITHPDPSLAYNGTWHDHTYFPSHGFTPAIEISFTGNALYIFFIIANTVPSDSATLTDVYFVLDYVNVSSYTHYPDTTNDYLYNVPVYANDSLEFGPHTMTLQPTLAETGMLMLFDYLIYSTDASIDNSTSTTSPSATATPSLTESNQGTSSGSHIGAIVGGTVGGVFILLAASLSCYWIYKRRHGSRPSTKEGVPLQSLISTKSASPGNPSVDSSAPARSPSPDYADTMKGINERSERVIRSHKYQEVLS